MSAHIAVDVGGTQLRAAAYAGEHHEPLRLERLSTHYKNIAPLERLNQLITSIWPQDREVAAIGVAAPGPLNPFEGVVYTAPNIPSWVNIPLVNKLENRFKVPVYLGNDANLAALGEWKYGAGQGHSHLIYLTVSTGIGGGIITDDRLLLGQKGLAAELGHVTVVPGGPICGCGKSGHLEAVASGPAIARWVEQEIARGIPSLLSGDEEVTARDVGAAALKGDALAKAALERAGTFVGNALADFLHSFNPSVIIIGGGVSRSGDLLIKPMRRAVEERVMSPRYLDNLTITTAALGDEAGLLGALALARSHHAGDLG